MVDEFAVAVAPVLLGKGVRLFDGIDESRLALDIVEAVPSDKVTHLTYAVRKR